MDLKEFLGESDKLFNKLSINKRNALFKFTRSLKKTKLNESKSSAKLPSKVRFLFM